jgi:tRNA-modifying protein YgfZ
MVNPIQDQKELLAGKAFVVLSKKVLIVSGEERLTWLNDIFSQKIIDLLPGKSQEALWLDVQGHVLRDIHLTDDGEQTYLITFSKDFDDFVTALAKMIFRAKVKLEVMEDVLVLGTFNQPVAQSLSWQDPWPNLAEGGYRYGQLTTSPWHYFESLVLSKPSDLNEVELTTITALRIAAQRPAGPDEIDEKSLPHEYDWLATAVHLDKGCYRGQESVAKIHNLGAPPRKLVFLHLDGSGHLLPEAGSSIISEDVIGKITSVANHFEMGPIALGLVKRSSHADQVFIQTATEKIAATVTEIVPSSAGGVVDLGDFRRKR